jgi:hypothetical protein
MTLEEENEHLRRANMSLQRRLEAARRDALLYAAQFCEDHHMVWTEGEGWGLVSTKGRDHGGQAYAAKLREIAR